MAIRMKEKYILYLVAVEVHQFHHILIRPIVIDNRSILNEAKRWIS